MKHKYRNTFRRKYSLLQCVLWICVFSTSLAVVRSIELGQPPLVLDLSHLHKRLSYRATQTVDSRMSEHQLAKPLAMQTFANTSSDATLSKVGGLGLASAQSRISLGSISTSTQPHEGRKPVQDAFVDYRPQSAYHKPQPPTPAWPTSEPRRREFSDVSMHIMGQPIDPRVVNHLHPDVTPFMARKLRKILAGTMDKEWTAETAPRVLRQRGVSRPSRHTVDGQAAQADAKLITEAQALNFTFRHEIGNYFTLPEAQVAVFRNWLVDRATCEMDYIWEDLGPLFWPRWIRRGVCVNKPGHSCSWPPGMKCRPSGSRALQLLHWKCEDAAYIQSRKRAAEQRNRRRTATNHFHSNFYDMKPVQQESSSDHVDENMLHSEVSLRDTHGAPISLSPHSVSVKRLHQRSVQWDNMESHRPTQQTLSKEERQKRRARRLIKRLSVTSNGYHCYWQVQKYLISDRCACLCS